MISSFAYRMIRVSVVSGMGWKHGSKHHGFMHGWNGVQAWPWPMAIARDSVP